MTTDFWIKTGDLEPPLRSTLRDGNGDRVDINGAEISIVIRPQRGPERAPIVDDIAENDQDDGDPETFGDVHYDWAEGDTDLAGGYVAEWKVLYTSGRIETFPDDSNLRVAILESLGEAVS